MSYRFALSILFLSVAILGHGEAKNKKERKEAPLQFIQLEYAKALSERHRVNATVLHVRATGGIGKVSYSIEEQGTPFKVDKRGHIWLMKKLNSDKKKIFQLTLKAIIKNTKAVTYAKVRFDVMNMKNHAPEFENKRYICAVTENTRELAILPPIRVHDDDGGNAGKLKRIEVVEEGIPFKFTVSKNGAVEGQATRDLDAEKETNFVFTIMAVDGGGKKSLPSTVNCKVVDANEFAPEFASDVYTGEVEHGKVYGNILEVHASDKDVGEEYGSVCKYSIVTKDVPFKISDNGILHLKKPLGRDSPNYCSFQIAAIDCGGQMSTKHANVTVYIKDNCNYKLDIKKPAFEEIIIPQCVGKAIVAPDVRVVPAKTCSKKRTDYSFTAIINLRTNSGKGCDRQQYEASGLYKLCGTSDFIDILPKPSKNKQWTSKLRRDKDSFKFDGKTVAEVPLEVLPGDFGDQFTVSTWIQTGLDKHKQVIVANSDKQKHNRIHFAIIKHKDELTVIHRLEPSRGSSDDYCNSDFHYKPNIFDKKWHHLTVVADGCGVKLFVDGQHQAASSIESNYRLHNSRNRPGLYVGAHWLGKEHAFKKYFIGNLSGMAVRLSKPTSEQTIRCMIGCREHININTPLPEGFRTELIGFNKMKVKGIGSLKDFETILQNIEYQNELFTPTAGKRKVHVSITEDKTKLQKDFTVVILLEPNKKPVITVQGCKDASVTPKRLRELGVPLCSNFSITYQGCKPSMQSPVNTVELLDQAVVKVSPPFKKGESFKFPEQQGTGKSILDDLELTSYQDKDGIVISGVANFKTYEQVLREMVYKNENPKQHQHHYVYIYVSDQNGRFMSDKERLSISMTHEKDRAMPRIFHKGHALRPMDIQAVRETINAEELPGAVTVEKVAKDGGISSGVLAAIIVCTVSVFVFLVVLGLYRLKKSTTVLEVAASPAEKEEMYWDDTGLGGVRITVNPLQKFQELDLNEDKDSEHSDDEDNQVAKQSLEWDEGAI